MSTTPIEISIVVRRPPQEAFRVFTEELGAWWPLDTHSLAADADRTTAVTIEVEGREGGRIIERAPDGAEGTWGTVLTWEPPHRLVIAWKPNTNPLPPTEVEVRFTPDAEGTLVELEHRGWERLGPAAADARAGYATGWPPILGRLAAAIDRRGVESAP